MEKVWHCKISRWVLIWWINLGGNVAVYYGNLENFYFLKTINMSVFVA